MSNEPWDAERWRAQQRRVRMGLIETNPVPEDLYLKAAIAYSDVPGTPSPDGETKRVRRRDAIEAVIRATLDYVADASEIEGKKKA